MANFNNSTTQSKLATYSPRILIASSATQKLSIKASAAVGVDTKTTSLERRFCEAPVAANVPGRQGRRQIKL
ncbi:hypothetical protein M5689_015174 [Euphorbia peplus]|nr:hypothetical protein M5689_015174 [Euphorbia peplus]